MLKIDCYAQKEYFVVEISGVLNNYNIALFEKEVINMIKSLEVKKLKINFQDLIDIDEVGLQKLLYCYQLVEKI